MILPPIPVANYASLLAAQVVARSVKSFSPAAFQTGGASWFEGAGVLVVQESQTWGQLWARHTKNEWLGSSSANRIDPAPIVDFNRNVLVAMFAGPTRGVVGYRLVSGFAYGKQATLRLAPVIAGGGSNIAIPTPWAFLVLPRTDAAVAIQLPAANGGWATVAQVAPSR